MNKIFYFILVLIMSACSVETKTEKTPSGSSDGTAAAPVELTVGTAKSGGIATNGDSYYQFTTSATGAGSYKLAIESMVVTDGWSSYAVYTSLFSDSGMTTSSRIDWEGCAASWTIYLDYQNLDASKL